MGDDIIMGLSSMAICFDFCSTNIVQLGDQNPYFYPFQCHHPLITQLTLTKTLFWLSILENPARENLQIFWPGWKLHNQVDITLDELVETFWPKGNQLSWQIFIVTQADTR